jgi:hypothetical protein
VDGASEPKWSEEEFSECRWQSINDLEGFDFIQGIRDDIRKGWKFYSKNKEIV